MAADANDLGVFSFREGFNAPDAGRKLGQVETSPTDQLRPIVRELHQEAAVCGSPLRPLDASRAQRPDVHHPIRRPFSLSHP